MIEARVPDWRIEILGGVGHSFTNVDVDQMGMPGVAYDELADQHSWAAATRLLEETLALTRSVDRPVSGLAGWKATAFTPTSASG